MSLPEDEINSYLLCANQKNSSYTYGQCLRLSILT